MVKLCGGALIEDDFGEVVSFTPVPYEEVKPIKKQHHFVPNGDGWFEATLVVTLKHW